MYYDPQVGSHPQYFVASFHLSPERIESCLVLSFITKTSSGQDRSKIYEFGSTEVIAKAPACLFCLFV